MSNPQITGRTKLGPTEALRAVFSGIGRILMAADRSQGQVSSAGAPADARNGRTAGRRRYAGADPAPSRWRSLDQTGNVRLLTAEDLDNEDAIRPAVAALPLASYDTLSLASIRARLRSLDASQLRVLADYEAAHAQRPEILGMLERRLEKIETGG